MNMKKIKVSEASNIQLDWLVVKCEGAKEIRFDGEFWRVLIDEDHFLPYEEYLGNLDYTTDWSQMGPIIEREIGNLWKINKLDPSEPDVWTAVSYLKAPDGTLLYYEDGPTPLIAAARCYVAHKLGEEVEVPEELV